MGARQSSVGTDQEPRGRQGWQTLGESKSCAHAGIQGKKGGHTVLEGRRCYFTRDVFFSKTSLSN